MNPAPMTRSARNLGAAVLLALLGCAPEPPSIGALDPASGPAGTAIVLTGQHFADGTKVKLGGKALDGLKIVDAGRIEGAVPASLEPGAQTLVVTGPGGQAASRSKAFEVTRPEPEGSPCDSDLKRMTHIPPTADVVKISVFVDPTAKPPVVETEEIAVHDIERVEYEARLMEGAAAKTEGADGEAAETPRCSAIYLRTKAGRRVLFDASTRTDLKSQAQTIANGIARPVDIVHEDPATPAAE